MVDAEFTNGVIAVKEKSLLGDKLLRFCEMTAGDVLRALLEHGFGGGAEPEGEALVSAEERLLDDFIREYAPSKAEKEYFLSPRDFHNGEALVKAKILGTDESKLLAPEGCIPVSDISAAIENEKYDTLGKELGGAVKEALSKEGITGAEVGGIFSRALFAHLSEACKHNRLLKKLLQMKADRLNILTAMRAKGEEYAKTLYVKGGKLKEGDLHRVFLGDGRVLEDTPHREFYALCLSAKEAGAPFTAAERELDSFETAFFLEERYELEGKRPFLYYVLRRRAEIQNVRMILVCLNAGLKEAAIKQRLRAII